MTEKPTGAVIDTINTVEIIESTPDEILLWCTVCLRVISSFTHNTKREDLRREATVHLLSSGA